MNDRRNKNAFEANLLRDVLARTSGSPCRQAEEQLSEFVDGQLFGLDHQLVHRHARGCEGCGPLVGALNQLREDLPPLAELSPGEGFMARVLAATSRSQDPLRLRGWRHRLEGLVRLTRRPRLHLEAAYLGAIVIWLLVLAPFAPLQGLPQQVSALFDSRQEHSLPRQAEQIWQVTGGQSLQTFRQFSDRVDARIERTAPARDVVNSQYAALREAVLDQDPKRSGQALNGLGQGLGQIWQSMTGPRHADTDTDTDTDTD